MIGSQQLEKVDPAFTVRTAEPGEKVIADVGDIAVFPPMTGSRIIDGDMARYRKARG